MKIPDFYHILDRCAQCGGYACWVWNQQNIITSVECSECANAIDIQENKCDAMITWNKEQREKYGKSIHN